MMHKLVNTLTLHSSKTAIYAELMYCVNYFMPNDLNAKLLESLEKIEVAELFDILDFELETFWKLGIYLTFNVDDKIRHPTEIFIWGLRLIKNGWHDYPANHWIRRPEISVILDDDYEICIQSSWKCVHNNKSCMICTAPPSSTVNVSELTPIVFGPESFVPKPIIYETPYEDLRLLLDVS